MQRFLTEKIAYRLRWIFLCILFLAFFIYFYSLNKFHLFYLEQTQLFRFSCDYFKSFLEKPGEFNFYLGEFLSQFFVNAFIGAGIVTFLAGITFFLSHQILKKLRINGLIWNLIPVLLIAALQSDHQYKIGLTVGIILALSFAWFYLQLSNQLYRILFGIVGWLLLYLLSGGFALFAALLVIFFELLYFNSKGKWINILVLATVSIGFPFIAWKFFYLIVFRDAWFYPLPFWGVSRMPLFAAFPAYFLVIIAGFCVYKKVRKIDVVVFPWNYKTILGGGIIVVIGCVLVPTKSYDRKTEILLGMDHYVQEENWKKVIELSKAYPGSNQLVLYYTNLALYKTGQMGDRMFDFHQSGIDGLRLEWKRNEVAPFFGGEVFYQLNYINEAYRWAFESMVAKGLNPRSLKRLVLTSLINRHYQIAAKYLGKLDQSVYYKEWADKYKTYVSDTTKINQDSDLSSRRRLLVKNDFISDATDYNLGLSKLLNEHPENRMAFEYQMAAFLLNKDIKNFAAKINRLKDLGYRQIPVNFEEALLFCMTYFKKDLVPEGFSIRPETIRRKNDYIDQLSRCGGDRDFAARQLYKQFGKTYWYYLHFAEQTQK